MDRAQNLGLVADASFVAGGGAAGVGLRLFLISGDPDSAPVAVAPSIGDNAAGLVFSGVF